GRMEEDITVVKEINAAEPEPTVFNDEEVTMTMAQTNFSKYIFDSMVRNVDSPSKFLMIGKGFSGVKTPLFDTMLVQPQADVENEDDHEVPAAPTPPSPTPATTPTSPTHEPLPPPQEPISSPPQAPPAPPSSPPQVNLLNILTPLNLP
nr:hypothetical protein [Tanacetum cinerariifolium]